MKLTNYHKQAIIKSIMDAVPKPNMPTADEIRTAFVSSMSVPARRLYKTHPKALRTHYIPCWMVADGVGFTAIVGDSDVNAVVAGLKEATIAHEALQRKVAAAVNSCNTRKQLVDRYPEFARFAPAEYGTTPNLPAVANLIVDLKAAGWVCQPL